MDTIKRTGLLTLFTLTHSIEISTVCSLKAGTKCVPISSILMSQKNESVAVYLSAVDGLLNPVKIVILFVFEELEGIYIDHLILNSVVNTVLDYVMNEDNLKSKPNHFLICYLNDQ